MTTASSLAHECAGGSSPGQHVGNRPHGAREAPRWTSTPKDIDKLLVSMAAVRRPATAGPRGLRLNYPEAVALLSSFVLEGARDGRTVVDLMSAGGRC